MKNLLPDNLFPDRIKDLLHAISGAGFFERSVVIGSWVMLIYQELYGARYILRTLDVDFAVHIAHTRGKLRADLSGFTIRFPIPEAFFLHKLIIARKRLSDAKRDKDLEQCAVIMPIVNDERMRQVAQGRRFSKETRRHIATSCEAVGFPLQRIGLS